SSLLADLLVVPGFVAHDAAALDLVPAVKPARARGSIKPGSTEAIDPATVDGRENLAQALVLRLLAPRGSLIALGHSAYGSRLHELVGQRKTDALRNLCRAFVLDAGAQEPPGDGPIPLLKLRDRPVRRVSHLTGQTLVGRGEKAKQIPYRFTSADFELVASTPGSDEVDAIRFRDDCRRPVPGTTLSVNYYP